MIKAKEIVSICNMVIDHYHELREWRRVDFDYQVNLTLVDLLEQKCLIDTIQWHLEDEVRSPYITANEGWEIKKKIDLRNQERTDTVEDIDKIFFNWYNSFDSKGNDATINSETPGWIIDRLSILCLKIFHMREQTERTDATKEHLEKCRNKLEVLFEQQTDLSKAFDKLISDLRHGNKKMKLYLQMKMYNDENLNPVLYNKK